MERQFYNATFERYKEQYDSVVYDFKPKSIVKVAPWPRDIGDGLRERLRQYGIFEIPEGVAKDSPEFNKLEREALKSYLEGNLSRRITNYNSYKDSMDKAGKTVESDYKFLKAQRWKNEIAQAISYEEEKMGEESFLPKNAPQVQQNSQQKQSQQQQGGRSH